MSRLRPNAQCPICAPKPVSTPTIWPYPLPLAATRPTRYVTQVFLFHLNLVICDMASAKPLSLRAAETLYELDSKYGNWIFRASSFAVARLAALPNRL